MTRDRLENPCVVVGSCLLAVLGVMAMRYYLGLDFRFWSGIYLAVGLTASIRRTSEGSSCTILSAFRGIGCLVLGLYATQWLGCPSTSYQSVALVPEDVVEAVVAIRDGVQYGH
jgi:hypothetical protein